MGQLIQFGRLNGYSWSIVVAFICATFAMQYHTANFSIKDLIQVIPLIVVAVCWCQKSEFSIKQPDYSLKKAELFNRDFFLLSFSFLLACLISLLFEYDNSDAKGWWVLIIYFTTLYGLFFSLIFSVIALLMKNHQTYMMVFSFLIFMFVACGGFFPHSISLPFIGSIDTFFVVTGMLLIVHFLFAIGYKICSIQEER